MQHLRPPFCTFHARGRKKYFLTQKERTCHAPPHTKRAPHSPTTHQTPSHVRPTTHRPPSRVLTSFLPPHNFHSSRCNLQTQLASVQTQLASTQTQLASVRAQAVSELYLEAEGQCAVFLPTLGSSVTGALFSKLKIVFFWFYLIFLYLVGAFPPQYNRATRRIQHSFDALFAFL